MCDHKFALQNYEFIVKSHPDHEIVAAYKELGPFDFFLKPEDEDMEEERSMIERLEKRKTGT